ncbi:hypothetical protein SBRY_120011 [Actinacidiphila bryophytorum]|uniref:Uncharacterized protein n=1 Tax=Actinacidiphila bryophytorum TaxID=1436133 RepID=A0A9W4E5T8_9ACTN|nr:hypothetical protein SBRY_120011 [Actinacidiphila bryophytorum]
MDPSVVSGDIPWIAAIPKSVSTGVPSPRSRMLPGLMSRCWIPAACAARRPASTPRPSAAASSGRSGPAASRSWSDRPSTSSITIHGKGKSSRSMTSWTVTTFGCSTRPSACASRSTRDRIVMAVLASCSPNRGSRGRTSFSATSRSRSMSRARQTHPMPPPPSRSTSSKRPSTTRVILPLPQPSTVRTPAVIVRSQNYGPVRLGARLQAGSLFRFRQGTRAPRRGHLTSRIAVPWGSLVAHRDRRLCDRTARCESCGVPPRQVRRPARWRGGMSGTVAALTPE